MPNPELASDDDLAIDLSTEPGPRWKYADQYKGTGMGAPESTKEQRKHITANQIRFMAQKGVNWTELAYFYGVHANVLRRHFEKHYELGKQELRVKLRQKQIDLALAGNPTMLIWLGKQVLKQTDNGPLQEEF